MEQATGVTGQVVPRQELTEQERVAMYTLMETFYDGTDPQVFYRDLAEKDWVLLLKTKAEQQLVGFTTMKLIQLTVANRSVSGIFSGDTIVHRDYWGEQELARKWIRFMLELERKTAGGLYWFLICKGYKTYRYLPVFYQEFYPRYDRPVPVFEKQLMDAFGSHQYPGEYNPETGVIHYQGEKDRLKEEIGGVEARRQKDPHVQFFLKANPGYQRGEDLVCLTKISRDNLNRLGKRLLEDRSQGD